VVKGWQASKTIAELRAEQDRGAATRVEAARADETKIAIKESKHAQDTIYNADRLANLKTGIDVDVLSLPALSACTATPTAEPPLIVRKPKPKPTPLPAVILQIKPQPSTASLQKASAWSQASEATLSSETPK